MTNRVLHHGEFIGERRRECDAGGFSFVEIADQPSIPVPRHTHEDAHFLIVTSGHYISSAKGTDRLCGPGTIIFNPAGTTHRDHFASSRGSFVGISFSADRLLDLELLLRLQKESIRLPASPFAATASRIQRELSARDVASPLVLEGFALGLIASTIRNSRIRTAPPTWLVRARTALDDTCTKNVMIAEVARECGVHPYHLTRAFRQHFGQTPGEFVRHRRLERAVTLLRSTRIPISHIALQCGFADQPQLTRSVRRYLDTTPARIRGDAN